MRILVIGSGLIGSVYAARLTTCGHEVTVLARGPRLVRLQADGIRLEDARSGVSTIVAVTATATISPDADHDLVIVTVRAEQIAQTLPLVLSLTSEPDVLFFGNIADEGESINAALGAQAFFGFPGIGGVLADGIARFVLVDQQKTVVGEISRRSSPRVARVRDAFESAGFPTAVCWNMPEWLTAHAAFIAPIAIALSKCGGDPTLLAGDRRALATMVSTTRQFYKALRSEGNTAIPANLWLLYSRLPSAFAISYWRRVMRDGRGELWFGAHCRAAPAETAAMLHHLTREWQLVSAQPLPS